MVDRELDIISIVKTIHKLKAGLSAVIGDNKDIVRKSQKKYLESTTINLVVHENNDESINEFDKFLQIRDRNECGNHNLNAVFMALAKKAQSENHDLDATNKSNQGPAFDKARRA